MDFENIMVLWYISILDVEYNYLHMDSYFAKWATFVVYQGCHFYLYIALFLGSKTHLHLHSILLIFPQSKIGSLPSRLSKEPCRTPIFKILNYSCSYNKIDLIDLIVSSTRLK